MLESYDESFPRAKHWENPVNYEDENRAVIETWENAYPGQVASVEGFFQTGSRHHVNAKINAICPPEHIEQLRASIAAPNGGPSNNPSSSSDKPSSNDSSSSSDNPSSSDNLGSNDGSSNNNDNPSGENSDEDDGIPTEPVAWVEDCHVNICREGISYHASNDSSFTHFPEYGPLSAGGLFRLLKKKRYHIPGEDTNDHANEAGLNANIRIMTIINLNNWVIPAVVATASGSQAYFLKDFLMFALGSQAFVAYQFNELDPSRAFRTFALEFHIPFCVLCSRVEAKRDLRKWSHQAEPIRQTRKISFVLPEDECEDELSDTLHEGQVSCLITGQNEHNWTCFFTVDTYFDGDDSDDSVLGADFEDRGNFFPDRPSHGDAHFRAGPRLYFLSLYAHCLRLATREFSYDLDFLDRKIKKYVGSRHRFNVTVDAADWLAMDQRRQDLKQSLKSISEASSMVAQVCSVINENICACEGLREELEGFRAGMNPTLFGSVHGRIKYTLRVLYGMKKRLDGLKDVCKDSQNSLQHYMVERENQAMDVQKLSSTRFDFFSAVAIAANILQANIITMKPTAASFAMLTAVLWILSLAFGRALKVILHLVNFIGKIVHPPCPQAAARAGKEAVETANTSPISTPAQLTNTSSFGDADNELVTMGRSFTFDSNFWRFGTKSNTMDTTSESHELGGIIVD